MPWYLHSRFPWLRREPVCRCLSDEEIVIKMPWPSFYFDEQKQAGLVEMLRKAECPKHGTREKNGGEKEKDN